MCVRVYTACMCSRDTARSEEENERMLKRRIHKNRPGCISVALQHQDTRPTNAREATQTNERVVSLACHWAHIDREVEESIQVLLSFRSAKARASTPMPAAAAAAAPRPCSMDGAHVEALSLLNRP